MNSELGRGGNDENSWFYDWKGTSK
jgi:hypothetical protein